MATGDKAKIKVTALVLVPTTEEDAPNNSIFVDQSTGQVKTKSNGNGSTSISQILTKLKKNGHSGQIGIGVPVSLLPSGLFVPTDSDLAQGQKFIGITLDISEPNEFSNIHLVGSNVINALNGLGFTPGEDIYMSETAGQYTNDFNSFTNNDDKIIRLGVADCANNEASSTAKDLVLFPEVILLPSV